MGNEMGNNNTSEFREEEQARTDPEKSLLEGGANEVKADEVADFSQKEARPGSDGADKLNGNHHVIDKEEEKNKECNTAEFHVVSEKLPDRTKEDNEVQANSKEDKTKEFDPEENRSDGNEHEHEKQASNQEEEEGEGVSNLNTTILALDEPKPEKTSDFKSTQHELLNIKAESFTEDSNKSPEECKDALGLSLNDTYHSADCAMADSEETTNMDRVLGIGRGIDKENGVRGKGSNFDKITQASEDPKTKKISDFDADQVIDTDRDADKEDDRERGKGSNLDPKSEKTTDFHVDHVLDTDRDTEKEGDIVRLKGSNCNTMTQASEDPKSENFSDFVAEQVIDNDQEKGDIERIKGSNCNTMTQASEDPKSENVSDFVADQVIDNDQEKGDIERIKGSNCNTMTQASEDSKSDNFSDFVADQVIDNDQEKGDIERIKGSHCNTMTQASEDPKSENFSDFVADQVIDNDQEKHNENDGARGKDSNFDTRKQASEDPKSETTSNFDADQVIETNQDTDKEGDGLKEKVSNFDMIAQAPKLRKPSDFDADQVIDALRDTDKEHDAEKGKSYDVKTLHVQDDPKSEKNSDLKSIHHGLPEKAESLGGSSDDGSLQESKYCFGSSLEHTEENDHFMCTEKLTNVDCFGAEAETDMEKNCDIIEPRPWHENTMPAAKIVDTKDEETAIDLIGHNTSCSQPEESLVIELPKPCMQVPEVENRRTVLKEKPQLREQGTETIVQDNLPTQSKISNEVQEEFNTIRSHSEENAASESVVRNQNETPGEDCEDSDEEYLEISEQVMEVFNSSIGDCKHKNEGMGETTEISTNVGHEGERREPEENLFEPLLGLQPQSHQKEASITFQTGESTDESISTLRQITEKASEKSKKNSSDSPHYIQTASATFTETKPSTNPIDEQNVTTLPLSTFREENQESPGRTSNESNSDNSVAHIEMRKSPSFNIDIQSEGKTVETEKIPLLYQIKTIEDLQNLQEISFPNPTEKRVVKLGRSESEKSRPSFPGFAKEKGESEMESTATNQHKLGATKNAVKDLPPPSPIRKGKRRSKSLIFGTCICCATAIN
ncbi:uncharacterized protein LOC111451245 isoform X2 [Cucurbita moschata]|uniref:Uncharacterized protein LOC111451245 isoform X2 n=1 Tax=Cucurbita moschata TaxID=3662 RepID=A0A6J1G7F8_CUCMO|nr:uncharacterized protein LOC111451245 isoform X2 [Cucurbita moschata]